MPRSVPKRRKDAIKPVASKGGRLVVLGLSLLDDLEDSR